MYLNDRYRNFVLFLITKAQSQNTTKEQGNRSKQNQTEPNRTKKRGTGNKQTKNKKEKKGLTHLLKQRIVQRLQISQAC